MKLDFLPPQALTDGAVHHYCLRCHEDAVRWRTRDGRRHCVCGACGAVRDRALVLDPAVTWWTDEEGEYWHETAGVFVRDARGRFLFFDRTAFPFGLTIPAGHVERDEASSAAAARELAEETGLTARGLAFVGRIPVPGDGCRRGADAHVWDVYHGEVGDGGEAAVRLGPEGVAAVWLTAAEALERPLTLAVRAVLGTLGQELATF
ncbi:NUDIX hydrolase [Streptomyces sp. NBC_00582]|uniref:NUDIX hydrolase n=1 Tax=Streptomyces sp. NBC_00582 TaxID=2975783 RepID=UPI0010640EA0|nr:NUDIX hydrolase [Streptomyces sp. NBC_00582]WUB60304.1 NUDIX hydrolase [Streptomyces sp. NBC_00582]